MQKLLLLLLCLLSAAAALAQHHSTKEIQQQLLAQQQKGLAHLRTVAERGGPEDCRLDSIVNYQFTTLQDSVVSSRTVWRYYGNDAVVTYGYYGIPLNLEYIDSTVFDGMMREVASYQSSFVQDSNKLVLTQYDRSYPHGATTQNDSTVSWSLDLATGIFAPDQKSIFLFDAANRPIEQERYVWYGSDWQLLDHFIYTYAANGKIAQEQGETWDGMTWTPTKTTDYTYDSNDSLILELTTDAAAGIAVEKTEYTYDPVERTTLSISSDWNEITQAWEQTSYFFDRRDALGRFTAYEFGFSFSGFVSAYRYEYVYDGDSECIWYLVGYTSQDGQNWNFDNKSYYYSNGVVAAPEPALNSGWSAYPNPAAGYLWVEAPAGSPVRLVDLQGKTLYTGVVKGRERIPLGKAQGAFLLLVGEGKDATSRMIVIGQ